MKKLFKRTLSVALSSLMAFSAFSFSAFAAETESVQTSASTQTNPYGLTEKISDGVILHAWCWSFNTIRENMKAIADAGFTIVQTPPAQLCVTETKGDKGGGNKLFGEGYWYYHYQPTDWKTGNYQVGTRDDFKAL